MDQVRIFFKPALYEQQSLIASTLSSCYQSVSQQFKFPSKSLSPTMRFFKTLFLLTCLSLLLSSCTAAPPRDPCGERCRYIKSTGKWSCKKVKCPTCYKCIFEETCTLSFLNYKCCAFSGVCAFCDGCDCDGPQTAAAPVVGGDGGDGGSGGDRCPPGRRCKGPA